ncbi:hypothetical protein AVEN_26122-1 [Araneus ventricosus]|uniref:Uncharacterized protein n=1 Tax=Araneus ventricosus TaxID=182803 RepID=A0A4Y2WV80_ARAVE|nr:hypothetical protein AVEN_26122-1 [Araneus ventricosus]
MDAPLFAGHLHNEREGGVASNSSRRSVGTASRERDPERESLRFGGNIGDADDSSLFKDGCSPAVSFLFIRRVLLLLFVSAERGLKRKKRRGREGRRNKK